MITTYNPIKTVQYKNYTIEILQSINSYNPIYKSTNVGKFYSFEADARECVKLSPADEINLSTYFPHNQTDFFKKELKSIYEVFVYSTSITKKYSLSPIDLDSPIVGVIYTTAKLLHKKYNTSEIDTLELLEKVKSDFEFQLQEYSAYLSNDIYTYIVTDDDNALIKFVSPTVKGIELIDSELIPTAKKYIDNY